MNCILLFDEDFVDSEKKVVRLSGRRKAHIDSVFRAEPGKEYRVGLLNGMMGCGKITGMTNETVEMSVSLSSPPPPPSPVILILALCRPKSLKKSIEAATSLGIKKIYIIESWRVEKSFWSSPLLEQDQLTEHIHLGLEQAKDTLLPVIEIRKRFRPFLEDEIPEIIKGTRALVAHPYECTTCPFQLDGPITLSIGPEGGFIPFEIELFKKQGFEAISLGERILRVEYAIPALLGRILR